MTKKEIEIPVPTMEELGLATATDIPIVKHVSGKRYRLFFAVVNNEPNHARIVELMHSLSDKVDTIFTNKPTVCALYVLAPSMKKSK